MNKVSIDFFNLLSKVFDGWLPKNAQSLKIEMSVDSPVVITVEFIPDSITNTDLEEVKFGLIEYPKE